MTDLYISSYDLSNKYCKYIYKYYYKLYRYFLENGCMCKYYDICLYIYMLPYIYEYLNDIDFFTKSEIDVINMSDFVIKTLSYIDVSENINSFNKLVKLVGSIDIQNSSLKMRYNNLKNLICREEYLNTNDMEIKVYLDRAACFDIKIFNMRFYFNQPDINALRTFILDTASLINITDFRPQAKIDTINNGNIFLFMCQVCDINRNDFRKINSRVIDSMVYDFLHVTQYTAKEQKKELPRFIKYINSYVYKAKNVLYHHYLGNNERHMYRKIYRDVLRTLDSDVSDNFQNYKKYYLLNVDLEHHNTYKLNIPLEKDIHYDYQYFFYILSFYNRLRNLGCEKLISELDLRLREYGLTAKLNYIRNLFKDVLSKYNEECKEKGYIYMYNMEILLGYRMDPIIEDELSDQWQKNFLMHHERNAEKQTYIFSKWFEHALRFSNYSHVTSFDVMNNNVAKLRTRDMYLNKHIFFDAPGAAHFHLPGIQRNSNKSQYFGWQPNIEPFFETESPRIYDNNSIVIKRETVKDRIVVNTSIDTYIPLCKIEYLLHNLCQGIPYCYSLNSMEDKALIFSRFSRYCMYNKYREKRYILLPLDYSSFDTTITFELIKRTLIAFGTVFDIYSNEIVELVNYFEKILFTEKITFKEFKKTFKYKYGVLSGWKITNLVESLLNFVISFGVCGELELNLVDIITMGDDLVLVLDDPNRDDIYLKKLLDKISNKYKSIGFDVHPIKNLCSYECIEFLRNYYNGLGVVTYPVRSLVSVFYSQPVSEIEYNNYSNYKLTLDKFIFKNGLFSDEDQIFKMMNLSTNKNISMYGYLYSQHPDRFSLSSEKKYETKFKGDVTGTQIYKYYLSIFRNWPEIVKNYVKNNIFSKPVMFETIKPVKLVEHSRRYVYRKNKLIKDISNFFRYIPEYSKLPDVEYNIGDYHINAIAMICLQNKYDCRQELLYALQVSNTPIKKKANLTSLLTHCSLRQLELILDGVKIRLNTYYFNSLIVKSIKYDLYKYLLYKRIYLKHEYISSKNGLNEYLNHFLQLIYINMSTLFIYKYGTYKLPVILFVD